VRADLLDERTRHLIAARRRGTTPTRGWIVRRHLVGADVLGLVIAFGLAELSLGRNEGAGDRVDPWAELAAFVVTLPIWVLVAHLLGLYDRDEERAGHSTVDDAAGVFVLLTVGTWLLIAGSWATGRADPEVPKVLVFWLAAIVLVSCLRSAARLLAKRFAGYLQNAVIVGAGEVGQLVGAKILRHPEYGINFLGFVDKAQQFRRQDLPRLTLLGGVQDLPGIVEELDVERVIVAFSGQDQSSLLDDLRPLRNRGVQVDIVPRFFDILGPGAQVHAIEGLPLVGLPPVRLPRSSRATKRMMDIALGLAALVVLAPVLAAIAICIRVDSPGPVLYRHRRVGRRGKRIDVTKFRTMRQEFCRGERYGGASADAAFEQLLSDPARRLQFEQSYKLHDDPRVTRLGSLLRRTSLDELPQLFDVLRGDLSLVGPRPVTEQELERYGHLANELLNVKPGITGYWQINGRAALDYTDRVRLEMAYVHRWSVKLDLAIMAKTPRAVVRKLGAY
jgi:exopolysaccharide biosynthesis polyprenyl glycosylphosphotransferase